MRRLAAAIALASAAAQPAAAQVVADDALEVPEALPRRAIDPATLDEEGLRSLITDLRARPMELAAAIEQMRRRFRSAAAEAFAQNAEATNALDESDGPQAYRRFTKVRATYADSRDPAVQVEVARAIQGQAQAQDLIEAGDLSGPAVPITAQNIRLGLLSHRLRRELVGLYGRRSEPGLRRVVAQERFNLAVSEAIASEFKTGPGTFLGIVRDYEGSTDPQVQRVVADVFSTLAHFERDRRKLIELHGEIIRRFSASRHPALRSKVDDAFSNKAYLLEDLGEREAAKRVEREHDEWSARARAPAA